MSATPEVETVEQLRALAPNLSGRVIQGVDLACCADVLDGCRVSSTIFLGCSVPPRLAALLRSRGALLFPSIPHVPFDPYHAGAYAPTELYAGIEHGYRHTLDASVDRWRRHLGTPPEMRDTLATALHDDAMTDALDDILDGRDPRTTVGVMGGHAVTRGTDAYRFAAALGAALAADGRLVLTGGGPGAMEAVNLGAACPADRLADAMSQLEGCDVDDVTGWVRAAFAVIDSWPDGPAHPTIGIPTWFYGHEPPNVFATTIVKYFSNALREDILLNRCRGGLVYLPGEAGTVQELFQALTGDFYATTEEEVTPLVLVGTEYWTQRLPAWPLVCALTKGRPVAGGIHLVDTVDAAVGALRPHPSR